jgi:TPR repeat protein
LERGAKRNHRDSLFNLGVIYHNGDLLPRKGRVSIGYLQRAAELDHPVASEFVAKRKRTLIGLWEWYFRIRDAETR